MQLFTNFSKVLVSLERGIAARRVGPGRTIRAWMKYRVRLVEYRRTRAGLGRREKARKCHGASVDARGARVGASRARTPFNARERGACAPRLRWTRERSAVRRSPCSRVSEEFTSPQQRRVLSGRSRKRSPLLDKEGQGETRRERRKNSSESAVFASGVVVPRTIPCENAFRGSGGTRFVGHCANVLSSIAVASAGHVPPRVARVTRWQISTRVRASRTGEESLRCPSMECRRLGWREGG